jgi:hypothetical protein
VAAQNKAWLNKGKVPRNPGLNSRISWLAVKSVSARSLKNVPKYILMILTFWNFLVKS